MINTYVSIESFIDYQQVGKTNQLSSRNPQVAPHRKHNRKGGIEGIIVEKAKPFEIILDEINKSIKHRQELSRHLIHEIEYYSCYLRSQLFEFDRSYFKVSDGKEQMAQSIEKRLFAIEQERRREALECWKDTVKLKEEFWKWFKQYLDIKQKLNLITEGIDNDK